MIGQHKSAVKVSPTSSTTHRHPSGSKPTLSSLEPSCPPGILHRWRCDNDGILPNHPDPSFGFLTSGNLTPDDAIDRQEKDAPLHGQKSVRLTDQAQPVPAVPYLRNRRKAWKVARLSIFPPPLIDLLVNFFFILPAINGQAQKYTHSQIHRTSLTRMPHNCGLAVVCSLH